MTLLDMSRELRTPLNAIIGVSEMLREALNQDLEPLDRVLGAGPSLARNGWGVAPSCCQSDGG
jgi:signal transduction histidine kinase